MIKRYWYKFLLLLIPTGLHTYLVSFGDDWLRKVDGYYGYLIGVSVFGVGTICALVVYGKLKKGGD